MWGIVGIIVILSIAYFISSNRKAIKLRTVIGSLGIQFGLAALVLGWETGRQGLAWVTQAVQIVIDASEAGIDFMFGDIFHADGVEFIFAFQALPVIIFFSSLISILYYWGIMQRIVQWIGGALSRALQTSKAESMAASANIFVGPMESALVIRPYVAGMTRSEMFAVMTGGLATVAGSMLATYALLGVPLDYLIAACFMAAPSGLLMAKIIIPETERKQTSDRVTPSIDTESVNVIDAAARGATDGLKLALNIAALLIAFFSIIALVNLGVGWVGGWFDYSGLTLEFILGGLLAPFAFVLGVPWEEALQAGSYIGQKKILNELVAYASFVSDMDQLSTETVVIVSFALCGFANIGSLGIVLGGIGSMVPEKRGQIARLAVRALIAASLANLLNAAVAGLFIL